MGIFSLLGAMLCAVFLAPHVWNTAVVASSRGDIGLNVLVPQQLIRWHCTNEESQLPIAMQILDRAKGSGPWDFDYLNVETGKYEHIVQLPQIKHEGVTAQKLNACAMNPMDDWVYCVLQVVPDENPKGYRNYIVRVGIADADSQTAGLHFVALVRKGGLYAGAFDFEGTYYFGPNRLHIVPNLHLMPGKVFLNRHEVVDKTKIKSYKMPKQCQGADYAFWEKEVDGQKQKLMWMLRDKAVSAIDVSNVGSPTCRHWKAGGLPKHVKGHFGAGWTFYKSTGAEVYFANNQGKGVYGIDSKSLDLDSDTVWLYKAGDSEATNKNDGANCISISAESPFHATPPPRKEVSEPPKKKKKTKKKKKPLPGPAPSKQPEKPEKPDYDWVLMGPNTVCRMDEKDPIIWPKNKKLHTLTLAHVCIVQPCTTVPKEIPLTVQDCQERCLNFEGGCHGVEYRTSESRCEILARKTTWFIDNTEIRTVPGPLDFECWLYKPPCDLLVRLRDHGANSASFDWAWSVCFPSSE